jgi:hypothetical protein
MWKEYDDEDMLGYEEPLAEGLGVMSDIFKMLFFSNEDDISGENSHKNLLNYFESLEGNRPGDNWYNAPGYKPSIFRK